jgi:hypothetical protein
MDIYIPKYFDKYITDGHMGCKMGLYGEYRAILRGEDGRIKYDSGWHDNMLLDQALEKMRYTDAFNRMYLGTSDVAPAFTQVGLQGSVLGTYMNVGGPILSINGGAPDYERVTTTSTKFIPGNGTGLIKEVVITYINGTDPVNDGCVRWVLTTPINKLAGDELTMEWRITAYPPVADVTGAVDISGVSYDYTMRCFDIDGPVGQRPTKFHWLNGGYGAAFTGEISANTGGTPSGDNIGNCFGTPAASSYGGSLGSYYSEQEYNFSVDQGNAYGGVFRSYYNYWTAASGNWGGQFRWGKTSDDTPLIKLNTHTLGYAMRMYPQRYVP